IYSESTEYVHPGSPDTVAAAHFMNERRFLSLDLLFGHDVTATIYRYLLAGGMSAEEYLWFMGQRELRSHCIMGTDYYVTNEHVPRHRGPQAAGSPARRAADRGGVQPCNDQQREIPHSHSVGKSQSAGLNPKAAPVKHWKRVGSPSI